MNVIVALIKSGHRVASIDTDSRQLSLTRYIENRSRWSRKCGVELEVPTHFSVRLGEGEVRAEVEAREFEAFAEILDRLGERFDFVVIDTPGNDSYRMRLSHAMADTLITPVNDSFVDLDVLGRIDGDTNAVRTASQYAELVSAARRDRLAAGQRPLDWIVVRNRIATLASRNQKKIAEGLGRLSELLGFRVVPGVSERVIFREFFPSGLTAFDTLDPAVLGVKPTMSHVAARREIRELVDGLGLPVRVVAPPPLVPVETVDLALAQPVGSA
jgi:chromosome partitioning protein